MDKPVVNLSGCTLCMSCVEVCPEIFQLNYSGYIEVAEKESYPADCVQEAIKYCPENVIQWEEE